MEIELITWNIDCSLYTNEQLEKLAEIVYDLDISIGNKLYDVIKEREFNKENEIK